jgi:hypothetical protein
LRLADPSRQKPLNYRVFHKAFKRGQKRNSNQWLCAGLPRPESKCTVALVASLRYTYIVREPLIEETYCMSMQSHLAELEKRHQALEDELSECLTHPAVDDLRVVELKRRKLQVKDEIEKLRHNGHASVH